ncbi:MAG: carboxypeptidase regulatory-like domain-containing protein [Elusimicrobia bacterium]|nr:carboxypeptidase regulatory-like domain-containing protein [Candidatus Liberimonas magnetica]
MAIIKKLLFTIIILFATSISSVYGGYYAITTVAGNGDPGYSGDGGSATAAKLYDPRGVAVDAAGNIYFSDNANSVVRKISPSGIISTIAGDGTGVAGYSGDGSSATSAKLKNPQGIAVDASGNVYIADFGNNVIRKVDASGNISTIAGTGTADFSGDGGSAASSALNQPWGVAVDASGNVYIAEYNNQKIRKVTSGIISTFAGTGVFGYSGDGGNATSAKLWNPTHVAVDASGNVYIADMGNRRIRKVTSGIITTIAGNGTAAYLGDGDSATSAELNVPWGVAVDVSGNVYIADYYNQRIRKVSSGLISTIAGDGTAGFSGDGGNATSAHINFPQEIAVDVAGNVYIGDSANNRIRKVYYQPTGIISGNVTNSDGITAVSGALVTALQTNVMKSSSTTDSSGHYSLTLSTGIYNVRISLSGYIPQTIPNQKINEGLTTTVNLALYASGAQTWANISCGSSYTLGIMTDGSLWAWGNNSNGQLGLGDKNDRRTPTRVGTDTNWFIVSCNGRGDTNGNEDFTVAIKSDGSLWAWGSNYYGQLGLSDTNDRYVPTQVGTTADWATVYAGYARTLAIKNDGTLWSCGLNNWGQLGLNDIVARYVLTKVGTAANWSSVSGGNAFSMATRTDNTLWVWGFNNENELGLGDTGARYIPTQLGLANNWASISCGWNHALGILTDGTLWAWGYNLYGGLGLGDKIQRAIPAQVGTAANWANVSSDGNGLGGNYSMAIKADGTLWATGNNNSGELGLGDTTLRATPTQVGTVTNWSSVSGGYRHTLAIKTDGTLWAWGASSFGELGLGDTTNRTTPVQVLVMSNNIPGTGTLAGKVTKSDGTTAISSVLIEILQSNVVKSNATTNATGNYSIPVASGTYDVRATLTGYQSQTKTGYYVTNGSTVAVNISLVQISQGQKGIIAGNTTKADGTTIISGALIEVSQSGVTKSSILTDTNGNYSITIGTGTYDVKASMSGYQALIKNGYSVTNGSTATVNFYLTAVSSAQTGTLSCTITSSDGSALTNALIKVYLGSTLVDEQYSDSLGKYNFSLGAGNYDITVTKAGYQTATQKGISVTASQTASASFSLAQSVVAKIGTLTCNVQCNGTPVVNAVIRITQNNNLIDMEQSDSLGTYSFSLSVGAYDINVSKTDYQTTTQTGVVVSNNQTTNVYLSLLATIQAKPQPDKQTTLGDNLFSPSSGGVCKVGFNVPQSGGVTIKIYDLKRRLVRSAIDNTSYTAGSYQWNWDGKNESGKVVPPGMYMLYFKYPGGSETRKIGVQ